ncbi:MAG: GAF domain-containing protein, partial [Myxococcales bacterium]|nr:GAF domain-containing protein [Myxococcales bacterium]
LREAALAKVGGEEQARLRAAAGRWLLSRLEPAQLGARIFEVVDHLEAGWSGGDGDGESLDALALAALELRAARRAYADGAHALALRYLESGLAHGDRAREAVALEGEDAVHYRLLVELQLLAAQVRAATSGATVAESAFMELMSWPLAPRDRGRAAGGWIAALTLAGRGREALTFARAALAELGCEVPVRVSRRRLRQSLLEVWQEWRPLALSETTALSRCVDPQALAVLDILEPLKSASYIVAPSIYQMLVVTHARWTLAHGRSEGTSLNLVQLAIGVGHHLGQSDEAVALAELGVALARREDPEPVRIRVESAASLFVMALARPFAVILENLPKLYVGALEAGDLLWAGYVGAIGPAMHLEVGTHLQTLRRLSEQFLSEVGPRASREATVTATMLGWLAAELMGVDAPEPSFAELSAYGRCVVAANRTLVDLLLRRDRQALAEATSISETVEQVMFGSWVLPRIALITLVAAHRLGTAGETLDAEAEAACRRARRILQGWSDQRNFGHYHALAEGLRLARGGRGSQAVRALERARLLARERGCRWVEGLAAEFAVEAAAGAGLESYAAGARAAAEDCYRLWGAAAKLEQLRGAGPGSGEDSGRARTSVPSLPLDFQALLRSVAAISADLRDDLIVDAVVAAAITGAGADRGAVVLVREGEPVLAAHVEVSAQDESGRRSLLAGPIGLDDAQDRLPATLVRFILRTAQAVVVDEAAEDPRFADDPYLRRSGVRSLLGLPIVKGRETLGVLVLENRPSRAGFTVARLEVLRLIAGQAAVTLDLAQAHRALREGEARWRSLVDG